MNGSLPEIVVINPLSSGRGYGQEIRNKGYHALAVVTRKKFPGRLQKLHSVDGFDEILYVECIEDAKIRMWGRPVCAVIPGSDSALEICDQLADQLGVKGNSIQTSKARVDKFEMKRQLQIAGIQIAPAHALSASDFTRGCSPEIPLPVVVKPRYGTGAKNVRVCKSEVEIYEALKAIELNPDSGSVDELEALIEAYVEGVEYFVATANLGEGRRQIICFAEYEKLQVGQYPSIYRSIRSLPIDREQAGEIFNYVEQVNFALGADVGINDVEFKVNSSGCYLIEQNGRLPGANVPYLIEQCTGINCYSLNLDIYLGNTSFAVDVPYYHKNFCICCLISEQGGKVIGVEGKALVESLTSFHELHFLFDEGDLISATSDFLSTWGFVYLIHEDSELLNRECDIVHECLRLNFE